MVWEERILTIEENGESKLKQNIPTSTNQDNGIKTDVAFYNGYVTIEPYKWWGKI